MPFVMGLSGFKRPISAEMPRDPPAYGRRGRERVTMGSGQLGRSTAGVTSTRVTDHLRKGETRSAHGRTRLGWLNASRSIRTHLRAVAYRMLGPARGSR